MGTAKIVVASNAVTGYTITNKGEGYKDDEELTFADADVGFQEAQAVRPRSMVLKLTAPLDCNLN